MHGGAGHALNRMDHQCRCSAVHRNKLDGAVWLFREAVILLRLSDERCDTRLGEAARRFGAALRFHAVGKTIAPTIYPVGDQLAVIHLSPATARRSPWHLGLRPRRLFLSAKARPTFSAVCSRTIDHSSAVRPRSIGSSPILCSAALKFSGASHAAHGDETRLATLTARPRATYSVSGSAD